jgi:uncharacterized membrane protein YhaH (DUF805 family)
MNFGQAISSGFSNYVKFSGRAVRSEYWFWILFIVVGHIVAAIIDAVLGIYAIRPLFHLATILPTIAVAVRRLHDTDRTGWWILIGLIPIVGWIILIIWYCEKGTPGPNRFGSEGVVLAAA